MSDLINEKEKESMLSSQISTKTETSATSSATGDNVNSVKSSLAFTRFKLTYSNDEDLEVFFSIPKSEYDSKQNDFVGICLLFTNDFLVYKTLNECDVDPEFDHLNGEKITSIPDKEYIVKKAVFKTPELSSTSERPVYFQFCYKDSNGVVLSKSTPFQIKGVGAPSNPATEIIESIMQNNENDNIEGQDEDEYIVVRSQDSFLKERLEHLTRKCNLMEYIIRSMEKDLSTKILVNKELQNELDDLKQQITDLKDEKEKVEENLLASNNRLTLLESENENLQNLNKNLQDKSNEHLSLVQSENERLINENKNLQNLIANEQNKTRSLMSEIEKLKQEHEKFQEQNKKRRETFKLDNFLFDTIFKLKDNLDMTKHCLEETLKEHLKNRSENGSPKHSSTEKSQKSTDEQSSSNEISPSAPMPEDQNSNTNNSTAPIDPIDQALRDLEMAEDEFESRQTAVKSVVDVESNETPIDRKSVQNTSAEPAPASAPTTTTENCENNITFVKMPCVMCDKVIICKQNNNGKEEQMVELIEHFEKVHSQKMCPICSALFDTRLNIFKKYFKIHVDNHFNQAKYPKNQN